MDVMVFHVDAEASANSILQKLRTHGCQSCTLQRDCEPLALPVDQHQMPEVNVNEIVTQARASAGQAGGSDLFHLFVVNGRLRAQIDRLLVHEFERISTASALMEHLDEPKVTELADALGLASVLGYLTRQESLILCEPPAQPLLASWRFPFWLAGDQTFNGEDGKYLLDAICQADTSSDLTRLLRSGSLLELFDRMRLDNWGAYHPKTYLFNDAYQFLSEYECQSTENTQAINRLCADLFAERALVAERTIAESLILARYLAR